MIAMALAVAAAPQTTITVAPADDIWIYPHAPDQVSDPYLRVWGSSEGAVGEVGEFAMSFSFSVVRFELPKTATGKLKSAKLIVTSVADITYTNEEAVEHPLQARRVIADFDEDSWEKSMSKSVAPSAKKDVIFGFNTEKPPTNNEEFKIVIDLMKGPASIAKEVEASMKTPARAIAFALTSSLDPEGTEGAIYKFYSRSVEEKAKRPQLVLEFD